MVSPYLFGNSFISIFELIVQQLLSVGKRLGDMFSHFAIGSTKSYIFERDSMQLSISGEIKRVKAPLRSSNSSHTRLPSGSLADRKITFFIRCRVRLPSLPCIKIIGLHTLLGKLVKPISRLAHSRAFEI